MLTEYPDQYSDFYKANFYLVMGDSYRGLGEYDKCLAAYQKAILTDKTYREPYVNMAKVLNELHYYQQAIGVVKECINTSYRHYDWLERGECWAGALYDILSISYYYVGDYENSLANIYKALYYNPKDERLLSNLKFIEEKLF
jgi:tetratricopeptide (TPR) repeat protein